MRVCSSSKLCHCGKMRGHHSIKEASLCSQFGEREIKKNQGKYFQRLEIIGQIVRERKEISELELTREIDYLIPTTPWTIKRMKPDILETYQDIQYSKSIRGYYVYTTLDNFTSLS